MTSHVIQTLTGINARGSTRPCDAAERREAVLDHAGDNNGSSSATRHDPADGGRQGITGAAGAEVAPRLDA